MLLQAWLGVAETIVWQHRGNAKILELSEKKLQPKYFLSTKQSHRSLE